jgi:non-homologous end joining protein Ku
MPFNLMVREQKKKKKTFSTEKPAASREKNPIRLCEALSLSILIAN